MQHQRQVQRRKMQTRNAHRPRIDQGVDDARRVKYNTTMQQRIPQQIARPNIYTLAQVLNK